MVSAAIVSIIIFYSLHCHDLMSKSIVYYYGNTHH